mgnify:CR=1 FL=1
MVDIVQKDNPILREVAKEVPIADIGTPEIQKVLKDMKIALDSQDDGVAIAAPQIGVSLRIFIVSGKVIGYMKDTNDKKKYPDMVFINPVITKKSREKKYMEEGCLSIRYLYGKVSRSTKVQITGFDEYGNAFSRGGSGLLAQVFQHETDHLNGILFIDTAKDVEDIPPEKTKGAKKK